MSQNQNKILIIYVIIGAKLYQNALRWAINWLFTLCSLWKKVWNFYMSNSRRYASDKGSVTDRPTGHNTWTESPLDVHNSLYVRWTASRRSDCVWTYFERPVGVHFRCCAQWDTCHIILTSVFTILQNDAWHIFLAWYILREILKIRTHLVWFLTPPLHATFNNFNQLPMH